MVGGTGTFPIMCCKVTRPEVKNIVVHFKISTRKRKYLWRLRNFVKELKDPTSSTALALIHKRVNNGNFVCFKLSGVSFTIFPHSGNVIGTGIKRKPHILKAVKMFLDTVGLRGGVERHLEILRITNSTYSGSIECVCLDSGQITIWQALSHLPDFNAETNDGYLNEWDVSFRSQFFPGIRIRHIHGGTVNLFNNGKFVLVGVKGERHARRLTKKLCVFMRKCWMTLREEMLCAWNAVM